MRTSTTTTFRVLIMLAAVVGITAAALYGSRWSDILDKFREFARQTISDDAVAEDLPEAEPWNGQTARETPSNPSYGRQMAAPPKTDPPKTEPQQPSPPSVRPPPELAQATYDADDIQHILQQLGAIHYLLETWGNDGELYRFSCEMSVQGNKNLTRHFEAVEDSPIAAMLNVLQQVLSWQGR